MIVLRLLILFSCIRSLETYSYSEVNRRAVADTTHANSLQRLADRWNSVQQHLIIEGKE